jgi:alpha-beta hydrolase superfamily lysophospholipase
VGARRDWLERVATQVGGAVDQAVLSALGFRFQTRRPPVRAPRAPGDDRTDRRALLANAISFYRGCEPFFVEPARPRVFEERRGPLAGGGEIVDLKWASAFEPRWPALRDDYLSYAPNRNAYARVFRHAEPRPVLFCIHGYRGGHLFIEERAFAVRWLYKIGLDVVLFDLPFHGRRARAPGARRGGPDAPVWPSVNVGRTNEGFAHAIYDLRALIAYLRARDPSRPIAVAGMSLGGYTTSLLATVEPLAFAAPIIPVASFPDLLWAHGEGRPERARAERDGITVEMLREAMAVHTPLLRAPKTPPERVLVISADGDRIAPPDHAARLARHFGAEELRLVGGHLLQLERGEMFRALARRLRAHGLTR